MLAIVTGAGSGMGVEITKSLLKEGYKVIMACYDVAAGEHIRESLLEQVQGSEIEVKALDLTDLRNVAAFARDMLSRGERIDRLMNNAGCLLPVRDITVDGIEHNVSVNYVGPFLLTRMLLPLMGQGTRIVNMASLVYKFGALSLPEFFTGGCRGSYNRFVVYSNTKLAITLFTLRLAAELEGTGITVCASDPWIVSTPIIRMSNGVVDFLCDKLFRPIIYTPLQGAGAAIKLLLDPSVEGQTGRFYKVCDLFIDPRAWNPRTRVAEVHLGRSYRQHHLMQQLWDDTEAVIASVFKGYGMENPL